jgi:hypothetical protein
MWPEECELEIEVDNPPLLMERSSLQFFEVCCRSLRVRQRSLSVMQTVGLLYPSVMTLMAAADLHFEADGDGHRRQDDQ